MNSGVSELKSPTLVSEDLSDPAGASVEEASDEGGLDAEENRPTVDLVDPEELCAHGPSVPEPEAEVTSEVSRLENCIPLNVFQLEDRLRECTQSKTPVTEVWPGVFIGNEKSTNINAPKKNLKYYRGLHITYCGLPSSYRRCFDINKYFMPAAKFTDKALRNPMSKVLIHCTQGLSHSATLFLVYLMLCHDMMVEEAFDHVMKVRCIRPYFGHLRQLAFLNADLVQQRKLKLQRKKNRQIYEKMADKNKIDTYNQNTTLPQTVTYAFLHCKYAVNIFKMLIHGLNFIN
uniref:Tyrosine specific protein phosphatases domain-containing protein n=1 Tax=Sinocyclocheilus anshuiensis TaxID=1608454 RepID=A0A671SK58_9TELE